MRMFTKLAAFPTFLLAWRVDAIRFLFPESNFAIRLDDPEAELGARIAAVADDDKTGRSTDSRASGETVQDLMDRLCTAISEAGTATLTMTSIAYDLAIGTGYGPVVERDHVTVLRIGEATAALLQLQVEAAVEEKATRRASLLRAAEDMRLEAAALQAEAAGLGA